jgi:cytochrome P450
MVLQGKYVHYNHELHVRYGEVVRVGPNEISYIHPQAWKDIYHHGKENFVKDPDFMGELPNGVPHIGTADRVTHSRMRKAFSHAFSERALREQETLIQRHTNQMVSMVKDIIGREASSATMNIVDVYNFTTFDMMSEMTFGESLRLLETKTYVPWVTAIFQGLKFMTLRGVMKKLSTLGRLSELLVSRGLHKQFEAHFNFSSDLVNRRLAKTDNKNPDIWHFVLQQKEEVRLSVPEMHSNASGLMIGGAETVATTLCGLTSHLLREPAVLKRLVTEIREAFATDEDITLLKLARLEYLDACITESLRLYPAAAVGLPRIVPLTGGNVCNDMIPGRVSPIRLFLLN